MRDRNLTLIWINIYLFDILPNFALSGLYQLLHLPPLPRTFGMISHVVFTFTSTLVGGKNIENFDTLKLAADIWGSTHDLNPCKWYLIVSSYDKKEVFHKVT